MHLPRPAIAAALVLAAFGASCDTAGQTTPEPGPTVTVTTTEYVTEAPTDDPALQDACEALVDGESLAFVFVTWPTSGTMVESGFTATGCANTFEASYQWRLRDASGAVIASGFGTATCGTGCVGTFQQPIDFTVSSRQVGSLEIFTASAKDGSDRDVNVIPLVLQP